MHGSSILRHGRARQIYAFTERTQPASGGRLPAAAPATRLCVKMRHAYAASQEGVGSGVEGGGAISNIFYQKLKQILKIEN